MEHFLNSKRDKFFKRSTALIVVSALLVSIILPPFAQAKQYASELERHQLRQMSFLLKSKDAQQAVLDKYNVPTAYKKSHSQTLEPLHWGQGIIKEQFWEFRKKFAEAFGIILGYAVECYYKIENQISQDWEDSIKLFKHIFLPKPPTLIPIRSAKADRSGNYILSQEDALGTYILMTNSDSNIARNDDPIEITSSELDKNRDRVQQAVEPVSAEKIMVRLKPVDSDAEKLIRKVLSNYNLGKIKPDGIKSLAPEIMNHSRLLVKVEMEDGNYYVVKEHFEPKAELVSHYWIREELVKNNFPTPHAYKNRNGNFRTRVGNFQYAVMDYVNGVQGNFLFTPRQGIQAAKLLARFHATMFGKKPPIQPDPRTKYDLFYKEMGKFEYFQRGIKSLRELPMIMPKELVLKNTSLIQYHLDQVRQYFSPSVYGQLPKMIIHGDFNGENLIISDKDSECGDILSVIDHLGYFDSRVVDFLLISTSMESLVEFTALYQLEASSLGIPLTDKEITAIFEFIRMKHALFHADKFYKVLFHLESAGHLTDSDIFMLQNLTGSMTLLEALFGSSDSIIHSHEFLKMVQDFTNSYAGVNCNLSDTPSGNWVWFKDLFFPHLTQREYSLKQSWWEDGISYVGLSLMVTPLLYLATGNLEAASLAAYFMGILASIDGHNKWSAQLIGSRAPPEYLKTAKLLGWINFVTGLISIQFPSFLPIALANVFLTHQIVNRFGNKISLGLKDKEEVKNTEQLIKKHTEPSLIYTLAKSATKTALAMNRVFDKNFCIVVDLNKFVKVKGKDIRVPLIFQEVLKGIVSAVQEEKDRKAGLAFVFDSPKRKEVIDTLYEIIDIPKEVPVSFSVETPEMAKSEIESKGLSVPFVLTLQPNLWKNYPYPTLALGKLIGGLVTGFEMKIDGEFKEIFETLLRETEGIRPENLIERNGTLILRKMTLQSNTLANPWEYQSFRIVNESA